MPVKAILAAPAANVIVGLFPTVVKSGSEPLLTVTLTVVVAVL